MFSKEPKIFPFHRRRTFGRDESKNISALENSLTELSISSTDERDLNDDDGNNDDSVRTGPLGLTELNSSPEPLVELVFVHGLGGGSRKSWSHTKLEDHFWPKSWLPRDPDFQNVRIHSFGYKSAKSEVVATIAGIPEYAESLLCALRDSPAIRHSQNTIILVGHSMGGLVIKKALIQAHDIEAFKSLATRIRSLYFLGTPHAGSEFTKTFQSIFRAIPIIHTTGNIADLDPASRLLESLNENFPRVMEDIEIRSFWENEQSHILGTYRFVVPRHSACLHYKNEVRVGLDADHRGLCKYDKPTNPNYIKVRNALSATVETILRDHSIRNQATHSDQLQALRTFLSIHEPPEAELADHEESCLSDDTCAWFTSGKLYRTWRDNRHVEKAMDEDSNRLILVEADPGAGKSVLASQVINNLQALNHECSYYFFDSQDREKSRLSRLLRSLAYQMALLSPNIRHSLLAVQQQNLALQVDDEKYLWRKLFTGCLFQSQIERQHYWVIDGLDECQQATSLLQMFLRVETGIPLKILLTSRPVENVHRELAAYFDKVTCVHLSIFDTISSIRSYVEARVQHLRLRKEQEKVELVNSILHHAEGSFLWVKLVLDDISKATGPKQIQHSMDQIPRGMDRLYAGITATMVSEQNKPALQAFLDWALCANPPLTVDEMETALRLNGHEDLVDKLCEICRNLVVIDHSNRVRAVHKTARDYLLQSDTEKSDFAVSSTAANRRIASLLIGHLRTRLVHLRAAQVNHWHQNKTGLDDYALLNLSDHVRRASPDDHNLFLEVEQFLTTCATAWIACIASTGSLSPLVKWSRNLRHWLQTRANRTVQLGELGPKTSRMQQWTLDFVRLVAKFGRHLLEFPGGIYDLVPPFVPSESMLYHLKARPKQLSITGLDNQRWDDRLCSMFYQGTTCTAVASGKHNFAIGLKNGIVHIYDNNTLQVTRTLQHGAVVKLLKYNEEGTMLLTAGFRKVRMWIVPEGAQIWELAVREPRLAAEFIENGRTLISISTQHKLIKQDSTTGTTIEANERRTSLLPNDAEPTTLFRRELQYAAFSVQAEMLATMQRERPIQLTDIEDRYDVGMIELELSDDGEYGATEQPITAMTFCANIDVALLAAAYRDGILAVFGRDLRLIEKRGDAKAITLLAGSPDGLTLAAANVEGVITLYDFEQLTPLHVLRTSSIEHIRSLVFSGDGQRIVDIRDRQANIWVPAALVGRMKEDSDSLSESTLSPTIVTSDWTGLKDGIVDITAVVSIPKSEHFVCGHEDGTVAIHSIRNPKQQRLLYQDASKQWISKLAWKAQPRVLASIIGTTMISVAVLAPDWSSLTILLRHNFPHPVTQLLFQSAAACLHMVVVTLKTISSWVVDCPCTEQSRLTMVIEHLFETDGMWLDDSADSSSTNESLTLVQAAGLRRYDWTTLEEIETARGISFSRVVDEASANQIQADQQTISSFDRASSLSVGSQQILLRSVSSSNTTTLSPSTSTPTQSSGRKRWILDLAPKSAGLAPALATNDIALRADLLPVSHLIEHVLGVRNEGKQLIFLNKALWVCSYDISPSTSSHVRRPSNVRREAEYTRHLFIPDDWISSNYSNSTSQLLFVLGGVREEYLVFVKKHEVAVMKEPFSHSEKVRLA